MNRTLRFAFVGLVCVCAIAQHTLAKNYTWKAACEGGLDELFSRDWCENEWITVGNWNVFPTGGYPDDSADTATIETDNLDTAKGAWLQINLVTVSISTLTIRAFDSGAMGPGGIEDIKLAIWDDYTVTSTQIRVDGVNGSVTLIAGGGAKLQTG